LLIAALFAVVRLFSSQGIADARNIEQHQDRDGEGAHDDLLSMTGLTDARLGFARPSDLICDSATASDRT
jgi:hypothetical protein